MNPHFIEFVLKINNSKIFNNALLPWIFRYYDSIKVLLVQHSAQVYGEKQIQTYLNMLFSSYLLFSVKERKTKINLGLQTNVYSTQRALRNIKIDEVKRNFNRRFPKFFKK